MSGFTDKIQQADGITIALKCGVCNQPATDPHVCVRQMLRERSLVTVQPVDPSSNDPSDLFIVKVKDAEEYVITRVVLERDYSDL